MNISYWEQ